MSFDYPQTRRDDTVDDLHGQRIEDPYRWLEDADSAETADWVRRQNALTDRHLADLPEREWFATTMATILHSPSAGVPFHEGGRYYVNRNDGSQNQDVWYVADTLDELLEGGRVLIDPNTFSADGTDSLSALSVSRDGRYLSYAVSGGGSDWQTFGLKEISTGRPVEDAAIQTKFTEACWLPDHASYLYADFAHPGHADGTETAALTGPKLRLHRVGQAQGQDELVLEFPHNDRLLSWPELSHDGSLVVVRIVEGTENRNRIWVYRVTDRGGRSTLSAPLKLVDDAVAEFAFLRADGSRLLFHTDLDAPRGRVVSVDLDRFESTGALDVSEVVPQGAETMLGAYGIGQTLVTSCLRDAQPVLIRYDLTGTPLGSVDVPGGSVVAITGKPGSAEGFVGMSSVTAQTTVYRFDADTGDVRELTALVQGGTAYAAPAVQIERRTAPGKDGTGVPYFLICPAGHDPSQPHPTLLYGYGGFKVPVLADYRPGWSGWLAAGGVLAIANLRGGGEFGTGWYEDGRGRNKQHVFDDFIAVAEHLLASGVTTTEQLAIHGRSNGGLLIGATMTQRPDLAAVALPMVGVLDLLRFHRFTIGAAWISDYGNPDEPDQFRDALAYSPLHNVVRGTRYPATLVMTGDHDDRVVPLHSYKFTAALQHAHRGDAPVLTRVEVATGHGAGKPIDLLAAEWADLLAFAAHHTGLQPA
ncbi:MAG TPA: prolyl oligopeptidase family serine peptidase [Propionibacteriaceae bacterium]|nr:prolyl oligopeptidase family serine peptidase [Propionibacteriaceae bacterium]